MVTLSKKKRKKKRKKKKREDSKGITQTQLEKDN